MNKTQKTLLVTAAIAGLMGGAVASANAKVNAGNAQGQNVAGKLAPGADTPRNSCNGCPAKTNSVSVN